jgi:hypothetical protein
MDRSDCGILSVSGDEEGEQTYTDIHLVRQEGRCADLYNNSELINCLKNVISMLESYMHESVLFIYY